MKNALVELVLREEQEHNAENSRKGRKIAHHNVVERIKKLIEKKQLDPAKVSFKTLWEKLVVDQDLEENITSSAFPTIAAELISSVIIQAYEAFPKKGLSLVRVVPSRLKESKIPGWSAIGRIGTVNEREDFPEVDPPNEKIFTIKNVKHGGIMSLTKETLFFDQTNQLMDRARGVGEETARRQDELIMDAVVDRFGNALNNGTLYSGGNNNLVASNPLGTPGWEATDQKLTDQVDDNTGKPIWVFGDRPIMIVRSSNKHNAWKLRNNDRGDLGGPNLDRNPAQDAFDFIIDQYGTPASGDWWYGSFKRQFRWEEVWPIETFSRVGQDTQDGFKSDVIQSFKASFFGGAGAVDTRYVIKNTP